MTPDEARADLLEALAGEPLVVRALELAQRMADDGDDPEAVKALLLDAAEYALRHHPELGVDVATVGQVLAVLLARRRGIVIELVPLPAPGPVH